MFVQCDGRTTRDEQKEETTRCASSLVDRHTSVFPPVLAVDALEVVGTWPDVIEGTFGDVRASVVVPLSELHGRRRPVNT